MNLLRHQRALLDHSTAVIHAGERFHRVKFVRDAIGQPVTCIPVQAIEAAECVMFVPEEANDSLQLLGRLQAIDQDSAEADRWRIYHGRIEHQAPTRVCIESGKLDGEVYDGTELLVRNPLADAEPVLCRWLNRERADDLHRLCRAYTEVDVEEPLAVGIDQAGLDIRARFGIMRVPSPVIMNTETEARATIERMIRYAAAKVRS